MRGAGGNPIGNPIEIPTHPNIPYSIMISHNVISLWGQAIVEELLRAGIKHACITPGGRSAPLAFAMLTNPEFTTYVHLDERSAGFFALGRAKRTGVPTPIVCTSGTAVANLHPSVIEADLSRTPMLLFLSLIHI